MLSLFAISLVACTTTEDSGVLLNPDPEPVLDSGLEVEGDEAYPDISHDPVVSPQSASSYVDVYATISDDSEILAAVVHYRRQITLDWSTVSMANQGPDSYLGVLAPDEMSSGGMHYYIEAVDLYGNVTTLPTGAPADYLKFDLVE